MAGTRGRRKPASFSPLCYTRLMKKLFALLLLCFSLASVSNASASGELIAPESTCPGQNAAAMLCYTNYARTHNGQSALVEVESLRWSAAQKSTDILNCHEFSHTACGREWSYWIKQSGYTSVPCWHIGENLAWGAGELGTTRSIFRAWMASPEHRANILGDYAEVGINHRVGTLEGVSNAHVWVSHFGKHC